MEENSLWQVLLAQSNINILNIDDERWYYEFMYHPRSGQTKWCKTFYELPVGETVDTRPETIAAEIRKEALRLRKELEK